MKSLWQSSRWFILAALLVSIGIIVAAVASSAPTFFAGNADKKKDDPRAEAKVDQKHESKGDRKDDAAGEPKKIDNKKDDKSAGGRPEATDGNEAERVRQAQEENRKRADEERQRQMEQFPQRGGKFGRFPGRAGEIFPNRLGVRIQPPDDALIADLGLAEGNGMVLADVPENSAAAKAGFRAGDIILKLDGKDVPSTVALFTFALDAIKTGAPIDAVILRNGKEETLKGIRLAEVPPDTNPRGGPIQRRFQFDGPPQS